MTESESRWRASLALRGCGFYHHTLCHTPDCAPTTQFLSRSGYVFNQHSLPRKQDQNTMMEKPITPLVSTAFPKKRNRVGAVQKYDSSILSSLATNTTTDSDEPSDTARIPSVDEFILRSKEQSFNCLENAYL